VARFLQGLHLRDLQKMGILAEVLVGVGDDVCDLATRRRANGTSVKLWGRCGGPPAAAGSSHPWRSVGRARRLED
jgi:hypothetical protein